MNDPQRTPFDRELAETLARDRAVVVPGFAERVVSAVRADRRRRLVVRWSSAAAAAAACLVAALTLSAPSEETLNRQVWELVARDESAQIADLLGAADDLRLLSPVADQPGVVDVLAPAGS
ncbi:MAG: hypothetical protein RLZZ322_815 [Verrucomicrobiota bacterium]|jgi:hypothetical protein